MTVSTGIPESWNLPLFWAVVDGTKAGNLSESGRALLIGQYNSAIGTAQANVPVPVGSLALAGQLFGVGSQLYLMVKAFLACNATQQLWAVPVPDGPGQQATATITITAGNGSGLLTLYIGGQKVQVSVASTDTATQIAANLAAAINALPEMPTTCGLPHGSQKCSTEIVSGWQWNAEKLDLDLLEFLRFQALSDCCAPFLEFDTRGFGKLVRDGLDLVARIEGSVKADQRDGAIFDAFRHG